MEKITSASQAISLIKANSSVMISGFLGVGAPLLLIEELVQSGVDGLTLIQSVASFPGEVHDIDKLFENHQVKKFIGAHIGTSKHLVDQFNAGTLEVEFCPMGTLVERIRAAGSGLGAVVTPVGVGTQQEENNQKIEIDGKEYLLYKPLAADFSLIKGFKADKTGNIVLAGTSKSSALEMALAGKTVIAEVDEVVETGEIAPDNVDIPGILVDYLVLGNTLAERRKYFQDLWSRNKMLRKMEQKQKATQREGYTMNAVEIIARRIGQEFKDGMVVNLGFGIPNQAANFIPTGVNVVLQAENGALRFGQTPTMETADPDLGNSGGAPITLLPGASTFDMTTSFAIIRGGHVDMTVLGALEVDQEGNIANWMIPGSFTPGMGGAMDLLVGAKKVIASIKHVDKKGNSKVLKKCKLPLSAKQVVNLIVTDLAVFEVCPEGLVLTETAPGVSVAEILEKTDADVIVSETLKEMEI